MKAAISAFFHAHLGGCSDKHFLNLSTLCENQLFSSKVGGRIWRNTNIQFNKNWPTLRKV